MSKIIMEIIVIDRVEAERRVDAWLGEWRDKAIEVVMEGSGEATLKVNNHWPSQICHYSAKNCEKKEDRWTRRL